MRIAKVWQLRGRGAGRSHRPEVISGVAVLAASSTLPLVFRLFRHRQAEDVPLDPVTAARPAPPQRNRLADATAGATMPPAAGRPDAVAPETALGRPHTTQYGLGVDQHRAHERGRPIAWVVVAVIVIGSCASGVSLIESAPWLFWTGVGLVVLSIIVGRATHAMRDELAPLPDTSSRRATSSG